LADNPSPVVEGELQPTVAAGGASRWWVLGWLVPLALQLAHTVAVAPTYHVGSFDDDGNYLMAAHVLATGGWLTTVMPSGATVVANYLPGYPLLLVPVVWLFGSALWAPRALSGLLVGALYPLLWAWMRRRGLEPWACAAVLVLLAINTVVATYSTMVMAEAPFLVVFVLTLSALDRWASRPGWPNATLAVVLLAELVWLKEAGIGLVVGLLGYELWRRQWRRALGVSVGVGALLLPGLLARWLTGAAAVGSRYASEIANPSQGGFLHQLLREAPRDAWSYLSTYLRQSVLPTGSPVPASGPLHVLVSFVGVSVPVFVVLGAVAWYRRHPGPESWMLWAYFAETLDYPFINQRRVILVLPLVTFWCVVGACAAGRWALALRGRDLSRAAVSLGLGAVVLFAGVPTAAGFTRNYQWPVGEKSAEFARSPAIALLKELGPPQAVVETDYRGTVAYFTGHRTAWTAFTTTTLYGPFGRRNSGNCRLSVVKAALRADDARLLMVGDVNVPHLMDSPCLLSLASSPATLGAVRLLSTSHDQTSVFELLGPGSSQPGLTDWTAGVAPVASQADGAATRARAVRLMPNGQGDKGGTGLVATAIGGHAELTWYWPAQVPITQITVGSVTGTGSVSYTTVSIETPAHTWHVVAASPGAVGDTGARPYFLARLAPGTRALALRVSAETSKTVEVAYVNAIGPAMP
jgi:hypothetical protein